MARRAVVFGSNGPPDVGALKFAGKDAKRVGETLGSQRCGFEVDIPESTESPRIIEEMLFRVAESCASDDTFVIFFSGHGIVDSGGLWLMLDKTDFQHRALSTAIRAETVVNCLRTSKANRKLLILDCCHAGMVYGDSRFKDGDTSFQSIMGASAVSASVDSGESFVAIVASDRLEKTREFDELEGSFLTSAICRALQEDFAIADEDGDGAINLNDLRTWLSRAAATHNATHRYPVPIPFMFGRQRGEVFLTRPPFEWRPLRVLVDEIPFLVIPMLHGRDYVWAVGETPVTNAQYTKRVSKAPVGEQWVIDRWSGPFEPLSSPNFNLPNHPVVCVDLLEAMSFAKGIRVGSISAVVTPPDVWDFAAFGSYYPSFDANKWRVGSIFDKNCNPAGPAPVRRENVVPSRFGVTDLIGNIWEWTAQRDEYASDDGDAFVEARLSTHVPVPGILSRRGRKRDLAWGQELRGGSFLDDMTRVKPTVAVSDLKDGARTKHSDLGFRLAIPVEYKLLERDFREQIDVRLHRERTSSSIPIRRSPMIAVTR